jgi:hypothetical protein
VANETAGYAHASEISEAAIGRAADSAALAKRGYAGVSAEAPRATNAKLYGEDDPLASPAFSDKVALLQEIDAYARARDPRVVQVMASLAGERRIIEILRADGRLLRDVRPLVRLSVQVTVEKDGRRESGHYGAGGRAGFEAWITPERWKENVEEALRMALVNLDSVPCPAGEMDVVLGPGWNGVLLHEAVGHGLEGDFNRKGTSAFSGRIGERVAAPGVTVFDDGHIAQVDPEGALLRQLRWRPGGHHQRQVRVPVHRGLPDRGRQDHLAGQGRHTDRRRPLGADAREHDRRRLLLRPRHRRLRQVRPGRSRRRRPAQPEDHRPDRRRHRGLSVRTFAIE